MPAAPKKSRRVAEAMLVDGIFMMIDGGLWFGLLLGFDQRRKSIRAEENFVPSATLKSRA